MVIPDRSCVDQNQRQPSCGMSFAMINWGLAANELEQQDNSGCQL